MRPLVFLLLVSCAAWRPTPEAVARRRIASELRRCYRDSNGWSEWVQSCNTEAAARCALAGLPDDCGRTELFFQCLPTGIESGEPGTIPRAAQCTPPPDTRLQL